MSHRCGCGGCDDRGIIRASLGRVGLRTQLFAPAWHATAVQKAYSCVIVITRQLSPAHVLVDFLGAQENTFIPTMTSQETLMFYAGVTLGENWPHSKRKERVAAVLAAVGLAESAHTPVSALVVNPGNEPVLLREHLQPASAAAPSWC